MSFPASLLLLSLIAFNSANARVSQDDELDSTDRNYAEELPRLDPLEPAEAAGAFSIKPEFRIELVASEPHVTDPVAMTFDAAGHLFVVEMRGYSEHKQESLGRIRCLQDLDGDGIYETSHLFAEGFSWPTAIIAVRDGIVVAAAPQIYFLRDTDGDLRADERTVVFEGFGRSNVQGLVNSFRWGLDHRVHGATSSSGAEVRSPARPDAAPLTLRGRDFAFDPLTWQIAATSGGAQHGLSFNQWGEKFVCANSNHIQFIVYDDRYLARNPYVQALPARVDIATDGPQADVFRASPVEPWRTVRTRLRRKGIVPGPVERGGKAAGYFTGATGVTIVRGDAWPATDHEWAIIGDVGSNLVHRKRLVADGLLYRAERVDQASELLVSSDNWFRPVQFANGPDGALYVLDMYREVIEHPKSLPPVIKRHLDLDSGRERGRIYRILAADHATDSPTSLASASPAELVAALASPNGWTRETAARLLYERQSRNVVPLLYQRLQQETAAPAVLRMLSTLDGLQALTPEVLLRGLEHDHPAVRRWSLRFAEPYLDQWGEVAEACLQRAADPDTKVRFQLAFTLGEMSGPRRLALLADLARAHVEEPYFLMAIHSSLHDGAAEVLRTLARDEPFVSKPAGLLWLKQLAEQVTREADPSEIAVLMNWLATAAQEQPQLATEIAAVVRDVGSAAVRKELQVATSGRAAELMQGRVNEALRKLQTDEVSIEASIKAINDLRWGGPAEVLGPLSETLVGNQPAVVQQAALNVLAEFDEEQVAAELIERWPQLTPQPRRLATDLLLLRTNWTRQLLQAIEDGTISRAEVDTGQLRGLQSVSDPELAKLSRRILGDLSLSARAEVIESYRAALELSGQATAGREVFEKQCANCHQVGGLGQAIGPNLEAMLARGAESVLINVLDPNREVNPSYLSYTIATQDGRIFNGMIASESANSITLQQADGQARTLRRIDLETMQSSGKSLMPEGLESEISPQQMADLLAFLRQAAGTSP